MRNFKIVSAKKEISQKTGFYYACLVENTKIVKLILENWKEVGIDIKTQNIEGNTALDILRLRHQNRQNEVITMLEEEYSKMDSSEPPSKKAKK